MVVCVVCQGAAGRLASTWPALRLPRAVAGAVPFQASTLLSLWGCVEQPGPDHLTDPYMSLTPFYRFIAGLLKD